MPKLIRSGRIVRIQIETPVEAIAEIGNLRGCVGIHCRLGISDNIAGQVTKLELLLLLVLLFQLGKVLALEGIIARTLKPY